MTEQVSGALVWAIRVVLLTGAIALGRWALRALGWPQPHLFAAAALGFALYYALRLMVIGRRRSALRRPYDARLHHD